MNRRLAIALTVALFAVGCTGSTEIVLNSETPTSQPAPPDAPPPIGPTPDTAPPTLATPPSTPDLTTPTPTPEPEADPDEDSNSDDTASLPDPPLPSVRMCTVDVERTEELNLRSSPSLEASIVFGIPGGSCRMRVLGEVSDGWIEVAYETQNIDISGFVSIEFAAQQPERTIALNWIDRVLAGIDTSDIVGEQSPAESFNRDVLPPSAFRAVPFDNGAGCLPIGAGVVGCPVHLLDAGDALATPAVIKLSEGIVNGEPLERVIDFDLCPGAAACDQFDFDAHGRIVADESGTLAGVAIGSEPEAAIAALIDVFGEPTLDTGWTIGCPLDDPDDENERLVRWGSLSANFRTEGYEADERYFDSWVYALDENRLPDPDGPQPWEVRLAEPGAALGMNITIASELLGEDVILNEVVQMQQSTNDHWTLLGQGAALDSRIATVAAPYFSLCD